MTESPYQFTPDEAIKELFFHRAWLKYQFRVKLMEVEMYESKLPLINAMIEYFEILKQGNQGFVPHNLKI